MTRNQILAQYLTAEIHYPTGEIQYMQLKDFYYPETIPEHVADDMISKLSEEKLDELKRMTNAHEQFLAAGAKEFPFLNSFSFFR